MRQNVVDNFFSSIIFCRQRGNCSVSPKLSMRSCKKTVVDKKRIDLFSLFRRENSSMRFSDLPLSH